jgi:hypothetical protein
MKTVAGKAFAWFARPDGAILGGRPNGPDPEDRPGADERSAPSVYWIDDLPARCTQSPR